MAVYFSTNNATGLLKAFNQAIANAHQASSQRIDTWRHAVHNQSDFYTHTSANWRDKGWFRADVEANRLTFSIAAAQQVPLTRDVYAYYAGHLIETFIRHFPATFTAAQATPNATGNDAPFK
jgi:hypothetical protein